MILYDRLSQGKGILLQIGLICYELMTAFDRDKCALLFHFLEAESFNIGQVKVSFPSSPTTHAELQLILRFPLVPKSLKHPRTSMHFCKQILNYFLFIAVNRFYTFISEESFSEHYFLIVFVDFWGLAWL